MNNNELEMLEVSGIMVEIKAKKDEIATYDYIGTKIAMGVATREEYAEKIAYTEKLRDDINELESQKESLMEKYNISEEQLKWSGLS